MPATPSSSSATAVAVPLSTVYGPVKSWRLGRSLGVDLLYQTSICSFRCVYCQLGKILKPTTERQVFVPTERVVSDLLASKWQEADVITFSGNGEPTLALNLGECVREVKRLTGKPIIVLTNATLLRDPQVRADLSEADRVFVKLDTATDRTLKMFNHPVDDSLGVAEIVASIVALRNEYRGFLAIQTMIMPTNFDEVDALCELYRQIGPDQIQLNTPLRPFPRAWYPESRGNHEGPAPVAETRLNVITREQAREVERRVRERTGLDVVSVYRPD